MCLTTLHDRVRNLGLGAMYDHHMGAGGGFRDLFDTESPEWASTAVPQKVIDLKGFESAGVPPAELIGHYRETLGQSPVDGVNALAALGSAMRQYRHAGYAPALPADVEAAVRSQP